MPLIFWAAQTMAASTLLGVGTPNFTSYISPTSAATTIQKAYSLYLIRRNRLILPCLRGPYTSRPGSTVTTAVWADDMNAFYRTELASMYHAWAHLPFAALVSYLSDLRCQYHTAWPPMSSDYEACWREHAVRTVLTSVSISVSLSVF
jgi:hypothetical protein